MAYQQMRRTHWSDWAAIMDELRPGWREDVARRERARRHVRDHFARQIRECIRQEEAAARDAWMASGGRLE